MRASNVNRAHDSLSDTILWYWWMKMWYAWELSLLAGSTYQLPMPTNIYIIRSQSNQLIAFLVISFVCWRCMISQLCLFSNPFCDIKQLLNDKYVNDIPQIQIIRWILNHFWKMYCLLYVKCYGQMWRMEGMEIMGMEIKGKEREKRKQIVKTLRHLCWCLIY